MSSKLATVTSESLNRVLLQTLVGWKEAESSLTRDSLGRELIVWTETSRVCSEGRIVVGISGRECVYSSTRFVKVVAEDHHEILFSVPR